MVATDAGLPYTLTWKVTPDLLGVLDDPGFFEKTNPAWYKTLGLRPDEIESHSFFDFLHPDDIAKTSKAFDVLKSGTPVLNFENRYRHKDGSYRWLSWNAVPEDGRYFCSARDITAQKEAAEALQAREEEAKFREQFIAALGHDLRNPLAAVASVGRILRREPQSEKALRMLDVLQGSVDRMASMIDDVMDFAKSRFGAGVSLKRDKGVPLKPSLEQAITEIGLANPEIQIEAELDVPDPVDCDKARIAQLLSNLLSNAVAHGHTTQPISVKAAVEGDKFVMSVTNSGPAIPATAQRRLFEPFFRASTQDGRQGLGLGLYIAAQIAEAHDGRLTVASDAKLTTFTFEMPLG